MAVCAPPPRRTASRPPTSEPPPQSASSGAAAVVLSRPSAAAVTATSTAPNSAPTAARTITSVRIAGARSELPRARDPVASGRHSREAGCTAKAVVASISTTPATASAAPVDHSAPSPSASGGPETQVTSTAVASTA